jgi:hypothetical protein
MRTNSLSVDSRDHNHTCSCQLAAGLTWGTASCQLAAGLTWGACSLLSVNNKHLGYLEKWRAHACNAHLCSELWFDMQFPCILC